MQQKTKFVLASVFRENKSYSNMNRIAYSNTFQMLLQHNQAYVTQQVVRIYNKNI